MDIIERPIIVLSAPRSGSTLLFETLAHAPGIYTIGGESHRLLEGIPALHPSARNYASNCLDASDATRHVKRLVRADFSAMLKNRDGVAPRGFRSVRLLEKTPKNVLRVPFLRAIFPDARFVVLHRDPRAVLSSMMEAWNSGRFVTYPNLPGWRGLPWSLLLVPGWERLVGRPLEEIVAYQWGRAMHLLLQDLEALPPSDWVALRYEDLIRAPGETMAGLCRQLDLEWDVELGELPLSRYTVSPPAIEKWRRNEAVVQRMLMLVGQVADRAEQTVAKPSLSLA